MTISHIVGLTLLFLLASAVILVGCERWIVYHPYKYPEGNWSPSSSSFSKEDISFVASDGVALHGWYFSSNRSNPTLLWFHGNAGNITHRLNNIEMLKNIPFLRGTTPWILMDFFSARRPLPDIQDYWNRKGLISDQGIRKKAFYSLQEYYQEAPVQLKK